MRNLFNFLAVITGTFCSLIVLSSLSDEDQAPATASAAFEPVEATIADIQAALREGRLTVRQVVSSYLERIKQGNLDTYSGPPINAFVALNPSIYDEAQRLDEYYQTTRKLVGPLHGIPVLLKDNIDSYDTPSTSGSLALLGSQPYNDAVVVAKLRAAGALILGKSSMDEFAGGMKGLSSRSGRVGNAYVPQENPGGSSGGSAAAVSASFTMVALGTDNGGSIRIPAAFNGIYGLRPTCGSVDNTGVFPRGELDGIVGPMARSIRDLAALFAAIAEEHPRDPVTGIQLPERPFTASFTADGLKNRKLGIIKNVAGHDPYEGTSGAIKALYEAFFERLENLGATLVDIELGDFNTSRQDNLSGEVEAIDRYLSSFCSTRRNFSDICSSGRTLAFGIEEECLEHIKSTPAIDSERYQQALKEFAANRQSLMAVMEKWGIDAFIMPLSRSGVSTYEVEGVVTWRLPVSSNSGLPSLALTVGYGDQQLPVGMEIIGAPFAEEQLFTIAYAYEQSIGARHPPQLSLSADPSLRSMTIPQWNSLLTEIGCQAYEMVLKHNKEAQLGAEEFRHIVQSAIADLQK
jgi:aspartyl-tRNA(Asn)/glutamyl-tRNA(Gln) amidotransferase subunit A